MHAWINSVMKYTHNKKVHGYESEVEAETGSKAHKKIRCRMAIPYTGFLNINSS